MEKNKGMLFPHGDTFKVKNLWGMNTKPEVSRNEKEGSEIEDKS